MCGIAGIYAYDRDAPTVDRDELERVRDAMWARGPDGAGLWMAADGRAGLAHRRLSIIDLSEAGAQPMASADGRYQVTFNGEIYNYRDLRRELEGEGCRFRSGTDTEVLLHLYARRGAEMVRVLRGMYAFAIYDALERRLFLARDPFGIKPLYFADDGRTFRFASQVKALLRGGAIDARPSPAGHVGFFLWGHVPDPHTLYQNIRALPAGTHMLVGTDGVGQESRFFSIGEEFGRLDQATARSREEACERMHEALRDSVRHHLIADVPVGLFLSSGLDSTTLAGLASQSEGARLHTVTLGFDEYRGGPDDETGLAQAVAAHYDCIHHTQWVSREDFDEERGRLLEAMDQPSIDGVNTYFVSRAAARSGMKVAISGLGGDELFGGYPSFRDLPRMVRAFDFGEAGRRLGSGLRKLSAPLLGSFTSPKYAGLFEYGGSYAGAYLLRRGLYMPWELPGFLEERTVSEGLAELRTLPSLQVTADGADVPFQKVSALEMTWYMRSQLLRDSDWAGMAHSLEIRVPLIDVQLFRDVCALIPRFGLTKRDMARAPAKALPQAVLNKGKTGFSIPVREWLRRGHGTHSDHRGLRAWARQLNDAPRKRRRVLALLTDGYGGRGGISKFNRDFLRSMCSAPTSREVVAVPRLIQDPPGPLPAGLTYLTDATNSKPRYLRKILSLLRSQEKFDLVMCCHINLLPAACLASLWHRVPLLLVIHGIDAWKPTHNWLANRLVSRVDGVIAVSALTLGRFLSWSRLDPGRGIVLPNSVDLHAYRSASKSPELLARFGLQGRRVLMTVGRLVSSERYKGFDEVIEAMPALLETHPDLAYMIVGEGNDRARLERKAVELGVGKQVIFAGYIADEDKCDFYNLADAFVMPSRGEGFGIVLLEAMACGIPAVGSELDGSREALRDGRLGVLVDPTDPRSVLDGIAEALGRPRGIPEGLDYFSLDCFEQRTHRLLAAW